MNENQGKWLFGIQFTFFYASFCALVYMHFPNRLSKPKHEMLVLQETAINLNLFLKVHGGFAGTVNLSCDAQSVEIPVLEVKICQCFKDCNSYAQMTCLSGILK